LKSPRKCVKSFNKPNLVTTPRNHKEKQKLVPRNTKKLPPRKPFGLSTFDHKKTHP